MQLSLHNGLKASPLIENASYVPYYLSRPARVFKTWNLRFLTPDLTAGLTVGLIALPQAIAFALIAHLPPQMGLYATVVAAIVGALWGSTNQIQTGPANAISILVFSALAVVIVPDTPEYIIAAGMLAVMAGVLQLAIGLTRLGILVNFVSHSVIVGFASGAAVLIAFGQVKHLLGLEFSSSGLLETLQNIVINLPNIHWPTAAIGLGTLAFLVVLRKINPKLPGPLISMIVASLVVYFLGLNELGVNTIGELPRGLPPLVRLPLFDIRLIAQLSSGALAIAAIGLIQTTAIARSISSETGQRTDNNQEFVGQGMANIAVGFFSGYPGAASFARSAVSLKAGAKTSISAIFAGLLVLLAMFALAPLTVYLPIAALAAVLIVVAFGLIDKAEITRILRGTRGDTIIMLVTFFGTLFLRMEFAVVAGILISFAVYLLKTSIPRVEAMLPNKSFTRFVKQQPGMPSCPQLGIFKISGDLYLGAVNHVEEIMLNALAAHPEQRFLLLRIQGVNNCDINGIFMLENLRKVCLERGGDLYFVKVQKTVQTTMQSTGFYDTLGTDHFLEEDEAVNFLFHHKLDPAICIYECPLKVFAECQNLPKRMYPELPQPHPNRVFQIVQEISPQELTQEFKTDPPPTIIDVREPGEYKKGHIPTAINIPLTAILTHPEGLSKNHRTIFVCRSGQRSQKAALMAQHSGYNNIFVLKGGMIAWETIYTDTEIEHLMPWQ